MTLHAKATALALPDVMRVSLHTDVAKLESDLIMEVGSEKKVVYLIDAPTSRPKITCDLIQKAKAIQSAFPKTGVRTDLLSTTRRVCHSHFLRRAATEHARLGLSA